MQPPPLLQSKRRGRDIQTSSNYSLRGLVGYNQGTRGMKVTHSLRRRRRYCNGQMGVHKELLAPRLNPTKERWDQIIFLKSVTRGIFCRSCMGAISHTMSCTKWIYWKGSALHIYLCQGGRLFDSQHPFVCLTVAKILEKISTDEIEGFFSEKFIYILFYRWNSMVQILFKALWWWRSSGAHRSIYIALRYSITSWHDLSAEEKEQIVHGEQGDTTAALSDLLIPP